jgi:hypothetical protein
MIFISDAYHESVQLGNELTKKINEDITERDENSSGSDIESAHKGKLSSKTARAMQSVLEDG